MLQWTHFSYTGGKEKWTYNILLTLPYAMPSANYKIIVGGSENQQNSYGSAFYVHSYTSTNFNLDLYNGILDKDILIIGY